MRAALERAGMKSDWPAEPEDTGGVLIHVDVGVGAEERPAELGFATLGSWVGNDSLLAPDSPPTAGITAAVSRASRTSGAAPARS